MQRPLSFALAYVPLLSRIVPTLVIGFCFVIPGSPIEGWNNYTFGLPGAIFGFVPAYSAGLAVVRRQKYTE